MRSRERLDALKRSAEVAAGAMRDVAQHLEQIADALPARESSRRLLVRQNADRLNSAASLLIAEVHLGDPKTAGLVARVGTAGLLATGALLGSLAGGVAEGAAAAMVQSAMEANRQALICVDASEADAQIAEDDLRAGVDEDVEDIRQIVPGLGLEMESSTGGDSRRIVIDGGLEVGDLGVPNARQRLVYLQAAVDGLRTQLAALPPDEAAKATEVLDLMAVRIRAVRQGVEILAAHDESLYPPQPLPSG